METRIITLPPPSPPSPSKDIDPSLGTWSPSHPPLTHWTLPSPPTAALSALLPAAHLLRTTSVPVAFPTETVYGLAADATRPTAVRGIYAAKRRPSDNPLIVHVCDLAMLRALTTTGGIPDIYAPLIARFWPGPLTILLPLSEGTLAPEVTAGLPTFGARLPASALARSLIKLVGKPLAAPSANASTRPSPTAAAHVVEDLAGRIEVVVDGGVCEVGVESTVVDGLSVPPAVLRPGGVSVEEIRACEGWEGVVKGYEDRAEDGGKPRAPGMKYKHYSPRARVVLTRGWAWPGLVVGGGVVEFEGKVVEGEGGLKVREGRVPGTGARVLDVDLVGDVKGVAHGLFAALRELDRLGADVIYVEGVDDGEDIAAAVMNRLRKAASEIRG
ncbi:DHBP synthase RibB-like alpha/beta domain-containing protein [Schizothecium vesticola]|uniref:Threonylcarbamoyl-AMP synthase n=1 Tax=Schizothecium vesticola TaxID=314040 RepID=A0AA40K4Z1_9PEZI|nr:DHBP synthase RibB-like alpha/beta domain-containing protein [Schizothecium vesticola]